MEVDDIVRSCSPQNRVGWVRSYFSALARAASAVGGEKGLCFCTTSGITGGPGPPHYRLSAPPRTLRDLGAGWGERGGWGLVPDANHRPGAEANSTQDTLNPTH